MQARSRVRDLSVRVAGPGMATAALLGLVAACATSSPPRNEPVSVVRPAPADEAPPAASPQHTARAISR